MLKAIIFDFDGVLTDTEPIHMEAWLGVLEPLGISFDEEEYRANYLGLADRDFLDAVGRIHHCHFDETQKARFSEDKLAVSINLLERGTHIFPGVSEFISKVSERYLLAICSGAQRGEIEFVLKHLKWTNLFDPIIASDSVKKGKPDPEGYIRALEGVVERSSEIILPEHVLAIEDSPKGIAAARAAGLHCLAISNSYPPNELAAADRIATSLAEFDPDQFTHLTH